MGFIYLYSHHCLPLCIIKVYILGRGSERGQKGNRGNQGNRALKAPLHRTGGRHSHGSTLLKKQSNSLSAIRTDLLVVDASTAADLPACPHHLRCYSSSDEQRQDCCCCFLLKCCCLCHLPILPPSSRQVTVCVCSSFCFHMFIFMFVLINLAVDSVKVVFCRHFSYYLLSNAIIC